HDLLAIAGREARHHRTVAFRSVDVRDALAAAVRAAIFIGRAALAIAVGGHREDELLALGELGHPLLRQGAFAIAFALPGRETEIFLALFLGRADAVKDGEGNHLVALGQGHAAYAGRFPAGEL